jgi:hypothetical protein
MIYSTTGPELLVDGGRLSLAFPRAVLHLGFAVAGLRGWKQFEFTFDARWMKTSSPLQRLKVFIARRGEAARTQQLIADVHDLTEDQSARLSAGLRTLLTGIGVVEHNVTALIDHYQRGQAAEARLRAVENLLGAAGCSCECDHHWDEHEDSCDRCLGCRIEIAMTGSAPEGNEP